MTHMTKAYSRFITALFSLFLGGILLWSLVLPDRERSDTENRTLAQWPEFSWEALKDGSYTKKVEEYFADQFPLRDEWTGLKAQSEHLIGKTEFNDVYLTEDGTLISQVQRPDRELLDKNIGYLNRLVANNAAQVTLGLIPSAAEVWKDKLPQGAESWDQKTFLEEMSSLGLPTIDFWTALTEHADEEIFYHTDHHWTSLGAFYGANAVLTTLGKEPLHREDFTPEIASDSFYGTLYSQAGIHWVEPDTMEYWVRDEGLQITSWRTGNPVESALYDRSYLEQKDKYSSFLGGNQPLCVIKNENLVDAGKVLIVRDSYTDSLAPFLAQRFSEVHLMDFRQFHGSLSQYAKENEIDDILVIFSIPNFITDQNLVFLAK